MGFDPSLIDANPRYRIYRREFDRLVKKGVHPKFAAVMAAKRIGLFK